MVEDDFQFASTPVDINKYSVSPYEVMRSSVLSELIPQGDNGEALDIGCGPGYFTRILSERGFRATSIDTDAGNFRAANEYAHKTLLGDAISVLSRCPQGAYGFALALEVIEHMPPMLGSVLLERIHRALTPGGGLLISTPNRFSPEGLWDYYWGEKIRGRKWYAWDKTHEHVYSSWELSALLEKNGFAIERCVGFWYEGRLPVIGPWRPPIVKSSRFPLSRMGFNVMFRCRKK